MKLDWNTLCTKAIALVIFMACVGAMAAGIDSEFKAIAGAAAGFLIGQNIPFRG